MDLAIAKNAPFYPMLCEQNNCMVLWYNMLYRHVYCGLVFNAVVVFRSMVLYGSVHFNILFWRSWIITHIVL